jgi:hypothetical protein
MLLHLIATAAKGITLLYTDSEAVIPAKAEIQMKITGFRVKPGMTNKGKTFLNHYTRMAADGIVRRRSTVNAKIFTRIRQSVSS